MLNLFITCLFSSSSDNTTSRGSDDHLINSLINLVVGDLELADVDASWDTELDGLGAVAWWTDAPHWSHLDNVCVSILVDVRDTNLNLNSYNFSIVLTHVYRGDAVVLQICSL